LPADRARARGAPVALGHILADGTIEPHAATEARLLAAAGEEDLLQDRVGRLAEAYRRRTRALLARRAAASGRKSGPAS